MGKDNEDEGPRNDDSVVDALATEAETAAAAVAAVAVAAAAFADAGEEDEEDGGGNASAEEHLFDVRGSATAAVAAADAVAVAVAVAGSLTWRTALSSFSSSSSSSATIPPVLRSPSSGTTPNQRVFDDNDDDDEDVVAHDRQQHGVDADLAAAMVTAEKEAGDAREEEAAVALANPAGAVFGTGLGADVGTSVGAGVGTGLAVAHDAGSGAGAGMTMSMSAKEEPLLAIAGLSVPASASASASASGPTKRGRGRPRKSESSSAKPSPGPKPKTTTTTTTTTTTATTEAPVKRRRGRPRKSESATASPPRRGSTPDPAANAPEKRRRGRPPKSHSQETPATQNQNQTQALPTMTTPRRKANSGTKMTPEYRTTGGGGGGRRQRARATVANPLAPRWTSMQPWKGAAETASAPLPSRRYYAVRRYNAVFPSWEDCRPFVESLDGDGDAAGGDGDGNGNESDGGDSGGPAEYAVFSNPIEAFAYLAVRSGAGGANTHAPPQEFESEEEMEEQSGGEESSSGEEEIKGVGVGEGEGERKRGEEAVRADEKARRGSIAGGEDEGSDEKPLPKPQKVREKNQGSKDDGSARDTKKSKKRKRESADSSPLGYHSPDKRKRRFLTKKWLDMLERLREFKETHGTTQVPCDSQDELYNWVQEQRLQYRYLFERGPSESSMFEEKIRRLRELGFDFSRQSKQTDGKRVYGNKNRLSEKWLAMYERAERFRSEHGSFDVLDEDKSKDPELFVWIREQRYFYRQRFEDGPNKGKMTEEKIRRLADVGLKLEDPKLAAKEKDWAKHFEQLKRFKAEHGHCNIPLREKGKARTKFQTWCLRQRIEYRNSLDGKKSKLTSEMMARLNEVGFVFSERGRYVSWETRMEQCQQFRNEHGHFRVPVDHPVLGKYIGDMRRNYKRYIEGEPSSLNPEKVRQLDDLGMVWQAGKRWTTRDPRRSWKERFQELLQYKEVHGHTNVPQSYPGLGLFVKGQRRQYAKMMRGQETKMTAEKALKLSEIGFIFDGRKINAEEREY